LNLLGFLAAALLCVSVESQAACGDPDAIGVSRTLVVDTATGLEVGSIQYPRNLPLFDMEVVLTFDDGPFPWPTAKVLDALRDACTKATFFTVGRMAKAYPELLRRELADGHSIGTHSYTHPESLADLTPEEGAREVDRGINAVARALGRQPDPFFRFPGLGHTHSLRRKLAGAGIGVFSADILGYDWTGISAEAIARHVLSRLKANRGGIVLLHDTKHATARMLPQLLKDMKAAGFHVVHILPAPPPVPMAGLGSRATFH
jgi:peptidoglycan/xylan/chitin deacetylase (PgdA/CDA1 family)